MVQLLAKTCFQALFFERCYRNHACAFDNVPETLLEHMLAPKAKLTFRESAWRLFAKYMKTVKPSQLSTTTSPRLCARLCSVFFSSCHRNMRLYMVSLLD